MRKIEFNNLEINHICNPKLKNSYISVKKDEITLKTPKVSSAFINDLLKSKEQWIRKKLLELQNNRCVDKEIKDLVLAKSYMKQRVEFYASKMGLIYNELKFRRMKRRWGSCSSKRDITLNLYLYNTSKELIDYVIVHELAHLVQMNHSKKFHNIVNFYMPNAKELEKDLKKFNLR
jgi:predicted metal-dependent hydrolase